MIPTAEDVVIQKLRWQRHKDLADVQLILAMQSQQLDWDNFRHWAQVHGTTDQLDD